MNTEWNIGAKSAKRGDESEMSSPLAIGKSELKELSKVNPYLGAAHILMEWFLVVAAIWMCERSWNLPLYVATVVWIGSRQHALMILMHDGVHYRLFHSRWVNEWVSEVLLAWPVLISARAYRRNHFAHHRYLNTEHDPDWARRQGDSAWVFPKRPGELLGLMMRDLSGLGAIGLIRLIGRLLSKDTGVSKQFVFLRYGFYFVLLGIVLWLSAGKLIMMYWFVPLFTWLIFIFRIRSIAEHSSIWGRNVFFSQTRTTVPSILQRVFVAPKNVSYHIEHHLYPSVPFYRLPKLHALLSLSPEFKKAQVTQGYLGVFKECITDAKRGSDLVSIEFQPQLE
jgi:fatty acid desaturase